MLQILCKKYAEPIYINKLKPTCLIVCPFKHVSDPYLSESKFRKTRVGIVLLVIFYNSRQETQGVLTESGGIGPCILHFVYDFSVISWYPAFFLS